MNNDSFEKDLENLPKPVSGSEAITPPVIMGNSPASHFLRARVAEGMAISEARAALKEWRAENTAKVEDGPDSKLETPLVPKVVRTPDKNHPIWFAILDMMQQRQDENGRAPSQIEIAVALGKSQPWISIQMVAMEYAGLVKKLANGKGYRIAGKIKRQIPTMSGKFIEVWGEDMSVPVPSHWVRGSCFLFKPEAGHLLPVIVEAGITTGCWVLVQKQNVAEDFDIVAHYDESWGLRLMEYGPAVMGKIEGKVIQVIREENNGE